MHTQGVLDQAKVDQFVGKVLGDTSATLVTLLAAVGDRLGLFKESRCKRSRDQRRFRLKDRHQRAICP